MSKIIVDTVEDKSTGDNAGAEYLVHGTAKAWANLDGTGIVALRDSFNISSVVDGGTGIYTFNFNNDYLDGNRTVLSDQNFTQATSSGNSTCETAVPSASATEIRAVANPNTTHDVENLYMSSFGDLA